jgi:hypothetical protein
MRKSHLGGKHFRTRAEECRTIAALFSNRDARQRMLNVAAEYERMADAADELASGVGASVDSHSPSGSDR